MINKQDFSKIRSNLEKYDKKREELIKKSRDVLRLSKQLIYSIHRGNTKEILGILSNLKKEKIAVDKIASSEKNLFNEGAYSEAMQEYVEAIAYLEITKKNKLPLSSTLKVSDGDYLMGICDLTGELTRKAVTIAHKDKKQVEKIKGIVEDIFGEFLKFNLRNGNLRKKSDSIKWNLKKLEEVMYDIKKR